MLNMTPIQKTRLLRFPRLFSVCTALVAVLMSVSILLAMTYRSTGTHAASSTSFTFTAAGDYSNTSATTANLHLMARSGAQFNLAIGDLNYDPALAADQWSTYVKSNLPPNFPFEIVTGNDDTANMPTFEADLPDNIGNISGTYGQQYSFDYPPGAPLARFILISPGGILPGYSYSVGSADYTWLSQQIDGARSAGIPWVIVGMHEFCIAMGPIPCTIGSDLENLLVSKKVDLVLQAHNHDYQASKQLALNPTTCPSIPLSTYNAACVVNATTHLTKGAGSVFVIQGTGGTQPLFSLNPADPLAGYMRTWEAFNNNATWGVSRYTVSPTQITMKFLRGSGGSFTDGFTITNTSPTSTPSPGPAGTIPVNLQWYFAEGRVGKGFREYLTIGNPTTTACAVNIQYLYTLDGSSTPSTKTVSVNVAPASRLTESVNTDLGLADSSSSAASLSAILTVNSTLTPTCPGVVAERPMYFSNFEGISSGTDVIGATTLSTTSSFADVPSGQSSSGRYTSYLTILNPNATSATVTATYYANGTQVQTQTLVVAAMARGTIAPGALSLPQHVLAVVSSTQPILVERPTYFSGVNGLTGAYDVLGAPRAASDWLFAEGYTGPGFQEDLTIANFSSTAASVTITLKSASGATGTTQLALGPKSQTIWNVNAANTFSGATPQVSAEVTTAASGTTASAARPAGTPTPTKTPTGTPTPTKTPTPKKTPTPTPGTPTPTPAGAGLVVQRELYFTYQHTLPQPATGGTDVLGQVGPATQSAYSFAEGYTNSGYNEWLTIQNPTATSETIAVTLVNGAARTTTQSFPVAANSRFTLDVTALVQQVFTPGTNSAANSISMSVQTTNGSPFVAERPMYWNTSGLSSFVTMGGSDVIGYVGG